MELCSNGYKFVDHPRLVAALGALGSLTCKDSLKVIILYRPPLLDNHRVPMCKFFTKFSDYTESVTLSKEHLLITGDFKYMLKILLMFTLDT